MRICAVTSAGPVSGRRRPASHGIRYFQIHDRYLCRCIPSFRSAAGPSREVQTQSPANPPCWPMPASPRHRPGTRRMFADPRPARRLSRERRDRSPQRHRALAKEHPAITLFGDQAAMDPCPRQTLARRAANPGRTPVSDRLTRPCSAATFRLYLRMRGWRG